MWPSAADLKRAKYFTVENIGDERWAEARRQLLRCLREVIAPPHGVSFSMNPGQMNAFLTMVSGFTSMVDWLGSMEEYFPYEDRVLQQDEYAAISREQAHTALVQLGWIGWRSAGDTKSFLEMFPYITDANVVQQEIIDVADDMELPALAILEAPTGIGKTEAALYLADRWLQDAYGKGLYIAMPTQATSNQMFERVRDFLQARYPHDLVNYHLLHGQSQWMESAQQMRLASVDDSQEGTIAAMGWFLPRKRSLLAPFAVGTVDQVLMSILLTKHFFVRLFGLSHKVVIFDEVHAYDVYMSTLFRRLLEWLRQLNTSVIILSATLPGKTRTQLIQSYTGTSSSPSKSHAAYPRLTLADQRRTDEISLPPSGIRRIALEWIPKPPERLAQIVTEELLDGGCTVVVCNTVRRAQEVFRAIQETRAIAPEQLWLFHAQFPFVWREEIERQVLSAFGKRGQRPGKAVLVATQVVEQSLDLDFDLMITDLAPIDLLVQRAGRLHRHKRPMRPDRLARPRLLITKPDFQEDIPNFGSDAYVYEEFVLGASLVALGEQTELALPEDTQRLIEFVYGEADWLIDCSERLRTYLQRAQSEMRARFKSERQLASSRMVLPPDAENLLQQTNLGLEEDDPEVHQVFQAMTRLIEPGVSIVCLHRTSAGIALEPDGIDLIDPHAELTREQEKQLLQRTVTIRHRGVFPLLLAEHPPNTWKSLSSLRHHRLAIFEQGRFRIPPFSLFLSRTYGLEIRKEEE